MWIDYLPGFVVGFAFGSWRWRRVRTVRFLVELSILAVAWGFACAAACCLVGG
ncbi:hypothetical protein LCGC14_0322710 [marine sediment metagenome]|uniref:Uncharacterized protein n=1 Tax=marine sediment metagenome TaxID=412755 RepID=A0A0F9U165_9ZZZZ